MPKRHSLAHRLAGAALARVLGPEQAAKVLGTDTTSIRRWSADHPSDDDWAVIDSLAGALLIERLATPGGIRAPRDLAVLKGIAGDKVRRAQLRAEREAQRTAAADADTPPEPTPIQAQTQRLDSARQRLAAAEIAQLIREGASREDDDPPDAPTIDALTWWREEVTRLLGLTDAEVNERIAALEAERQEAAVMPPEPALAAVVAPDPADAPPRFPRTVTPPQERIPMVFDGRDPQERGWHRAGEDIPRRRSY